MNAITTDIHDRYDAAFEGLVNAETAQDATVALAALRDATNGPDEVREALYDAYTDEDPDRLDRVANAIEDPAEAARILFAWTLQPADTPRCEGDHDGPAQPPATHTVWLRGSEAHPDGHSLACTPCADEARADNDLSIRPIA